MSLDQIGEFGLIKRFLSQLALKNSDVVVGPGDDCAVVRVGRTRQASRRARQTSPLLLTTDMLIEGIHFRTDWMTPSQIGAKAMRVNISDVAAMGGIPRLALISLGLPSGSTKMAEGLFKGMKGMADRSGIAIIGGDTNASQRLVINIVILGRASGPVLTRKGARVGDSIFVTGTLGGSSLGLAALKRRKRSGFQTFIKRHILPPDRVRVGIRLARNPFVHSLIDISDGLAGDLRHVLEASRVGAEVWVDQLPVTQDFVSKSRLLHRDPHRLALGGGEDYELLFTAAPAAKVPPKLDGVPITKIGKILSQRAGLRMIDSRGRPVLKSISGFRHF